MKNKTPTLSTARAKRHHSERGDFFIHGPGPGYVSLSDGTVFDGTAWQPETLQGEVVFNTGMTGYVESLTDPSYAGQILVFTYPLIGNYGVDLLASESDKIQVSGVVVSQAATSRSHARADQTLQDWLHGQHIPLLTDVDTRALTKHLRTKGTLRGAISTRPVKVAQQAAAPQFVSIDSPRTYQPGRAKTIILVDCGAKDNILRSLLKLPVTVRRVPYDYDYTTEAYDGVLLSNGPGDPTNYAKTIDVARQALQRGQPVFGICLGSQIMGLAAGAKTYKLPFGHRGHNQPCIQTDNQHCLITSQNHGYALDEQSLPPDWMVSFRNLNDNSIEGIQHKTKPFFSVQFHPEACPGPTDSAWLFERFYQLV